MNIKPFITSLPLCAIILAMSAGCSTIAEKTNFLSDDALKSKVAGTLGYSASAISLVDRRTDGTNTYAVIKTNDKKEFACTVNGGNLLSMGLVNPPSCTQKK